MTIQVIIVAGGKGKRMNESVPKQFLLLDGRPILMRTIEQFTDFASTIFLVLPKDDFNRWNDLVKKYDFNTPVTLIEGGEERFYSVKNAMKQTVKEGIVLIHDGVRPLVSKATIERAIKACEFEDSAIPVMDINESIRLVSKRQSMSVDRNKYKTVQTPQAFNAALLHEAYEQEFNLQFTDDASVFESAGFSVHLVEGNPENIKITTPTDLKLAHLLLEQC